MQNMLCTRWAEGSSFIDLNMVKNPPSLSNDSDLLLEEGGFLGSFLKDVCSLNEP